MAKKIVQLNVTGIKQLENKFNKKIKYFSDRDIYMKGTTVYSEESKSIKIYTDIKDEKDFLEFCNELKLTDIETSGKFNSIKIYIDIKKIIGYDILNDKDGYFIEIK